MAKTSLTELLAQKAELERTIQEIQTAERADAIAKVNALMAEYGLTKQDIGGKTTKHVLAGSKVPPKYRDPVNGNTWSGRGLQPKWLKDALAKGRGLKYFTVEDQK